MNANGTETAGGNPATRKIVALTIYREKGKPGQPLEEAGLLPGVGIVPDIATVPDSDKAEGKKTKSSNRELCLITTKIKEWIKTHEEKGLCFKRFKEEILLTGLPGIPFDTAIHIGTAIIKTSKSPKGCHQECELYTLGGSCPLSGNAVFANVVQEGIVRVGDAFSYCPLG